MKKLLCVLLVAIVLLGITGCSGETKKEPVKIELTSENFEEYFVMTAQVSNFKQDRQSSMFGTIYDAYADLNIKISPKKRLTTDNVTIKAFVNISGYKWTSKSFTLTLDVNGNAEYQEMMSVTGQLVSLDAPRVGMYFSDDVKEGQFLTQDKKFIIYELSGNVIED